MRTSNLDILLLCSNYPLTHYLFLSSIFPGKTVVLHEKICLTPVRYLQRDSQGCPRAVEPDSISVHALYPSSLSTEMSIYVVYLEGEKNSSAMKWKRNHSHGCQPLKRQLLDLTFIFSAKLGKIKKGGIQYW